MHDYFQAGRFHRRRKCTLCGQNIPYLESCCCAKVQCNGVILDRIRFGDEEYDWGTNKCTGCGVFIGGYHHFNCACEICPMCGEQILLCNCETDFVI